jgi:hypothetical protein
VKRVIPLLSLGIVLGAPELRAQGMDEFGAYGGVERRGERRSGQEAAFEIRVGPYRPNVDEGVSGSPYEDTFGDKMRWHGGAEIDWQALRLPEILSFGPGLGIHYTRSSAKAPLTSGNGLSAQDTTLVILPFHLVGVLRVDALADRLGVPFCPYAKLGLGYAAWWSKDGEEIAKDAQGVEGKGSSYGYAYALGLAARLDWLDPADAAMADASVGINHSALFIEYYGSSLNGFGTNDGMEVGTRTFVFGLMIEM